MIVDAAGKMSLLWTNNGEIRLRRSNVAGTGFLDEVGISGPLVGGVSKTTPRMISLDDKRLLTIWQTLQNNSAQIHVREVGILR